MSDTLTLSKQHSPFPAYLDFQALKAIGIRHLQALSSQLWTDYNLHDPGVTILEVLCYAITDLGYRNNLDIKDLLALNLADPDQTETNFWTADHILTCNPVTLLDIRKRLIDIPGVRNAWIEKTETYTPTIYVNTVESQLQYTLPPRQTEATALRLNPRGLYTVSLDLEPPLQKDACGNAYRSWDSSLAAVKAVLCAYRNLCEDIHDIIVLGEEEIALCADIELTASADPETVLVEIYVKVQAFLAPRLRFYTLQELLAIGKSPAEIFAGRPSALHDSFDYPSHGFIDVAELEALQLPKALYTSDLYAILMDVPGVAAIKKLSLINYINGLPQSTGHPWHLILTEKHRPVLSAERSTITFFKGDLPFKADREETLRRYQEQQAAYIKTIQDPQALDLAVPQGSYYDLAEYYSIHHDFPQTYGISEEGLPGTASALRKAQARQLKGYLIFFDQIVANYLAQLSHIRDLFSWNQDSTQPSPDQQRSYFTASLKTIPKGEEILRNFYACSGSAIPGEPPSDYAAFLDFISEDSDTYRKRRNQFLDHLLARFAETFSDYVLLNYQMRSGRRDELQIIHDKAQFISDYPALSRDRFRAFNYCDCEAIWDTENVSGFQKRVARLLGIADFRRRTLGHYRVNLETTSFTISLSRQTTPALPLDELSDSRLDPDRSVAQLLGQRPYPTLEAAENAIASLLDLSFNPDYYKRLAYRSFFHYGWQVASSVENAKETILVRYEQFFPTQAERQAILPELLDTLRQRLADLPSTISESSDSLEEAIDYITLSQDAAGYLSFRLVIPPVSDEGEPIAFSGIQRYATEEEAYSAAIESLQRIQDQTTYRSFRLRRDDAIDASEGTAETFTYYGYGLLDSAGTLFATTPERFSTPEAREIALQRWLTELLSNQSDFSVVAATECFFFEVRDRTGQQILLRAQMGLPTKTAAEDALTQALERGKSRSAYTLTEEAGAYGFFLQGEDGSPFALHPLMYATERERDLRLEELLYYFNAIDPVAQISGETGTFQAILLDREGNPLLITYHSYATQGQAEAAYQRLLHLASDPVYFQVVNDLEGENPYSFTLVDRRGRTFATHPGAYATACQRDWAIRGILNYVNIAIEMRLVNRDDRVFYELIDSAAEPLLVSVTGYETEAEATTAFDQMVAFAQERDRYLLIDNASGDRPYSFVLVNGTIQIAQHPVQYATPAERDQALQAVINQVIDAEPNYRIDGVEGQFNYALVDLFAVDADAPFLLTSVVTYPDEESARTAFTQLLIAAALPDRYALIDTLPLPDPYGFELHDELGERLAVHQWADGTAIGYATEAERLAAIAKIMTYAARSAIQTATPNEEGAFFAEIRDPEGHLIWVGQQTYPDPSSAEAAAQQIQTEAQQRDRYQRINTGIGACAYSFALMDATGTLIATHPTYYATAESRDAQILRLRLSLAGADAFVETPALPESDITAPRFTFNLPSAYFCAFQPCDAAFPAGSLFSSPPDASWDTPEAARDAFVQRLSFALEDANFQENYDNAACELNAQARPFSFTLQNPQNNAIALVSTAFARRTDLNAAIAFLKQLARGFHFTSSTPGTCCGYYYFLDLAAIGEGVSLRSVERYATEARAWQAASRLAAQIHRFNRYVSFAESADRPWRFGITDDQATVLAATTRELEPLAVFRALNDGASLLRWEAVSGETTGYRFQLVDRTGVPLLQGIQVLPDEATARDHFYRDIFGRLWEADTIEPTEGLNGYGFQIRGGATETNADRPILAFHPRPDVPSEVRLYPSIAERDRAIAHLRQTLRTTHLHLTTEQQIPAYTGQVIDDAGRVLLQGTRRHSYEWAWLGTAQGNTIAPLWIAEGAWQTYLTTLIEEINDDRLAVQAIPAGENSLNRVLYRFQLVSDSISRWVGSERFLTQAEAVQRGLEAIALLKSAVEQAEASLGDGQFNEARSIQVLQRNQNGRQRSLVLLNLDGQTAAEQATCQHGNDWVELAQNSNNLRLIDDDQGTCTFSWELTNEGKDVVLAVPLHDYASPDERQAAIQVLQRWLNDEGFHVIEHILLRPKQSPSEAVCAFDRDGRLMEGINPHSAIAIQSRLTGARLTSVPPEPRDNYDLTQSSRTGRSGFERLFHSEQQRYYFHYNDCRGNALFYSEAYLHKADRENGLRSVIQNSIVVDYYTVMQIGEGDRPVYFFTLRAENGQEIGRSRYFDALWKLEACLDWFQHHVHQAAQEELGFELNVPDELRTTESIADPFLPLAQDLQTAPGTSPCLTAYDPYSFWISVILPYWCDRFQDMNFRRWVERTLRLEAPAHVALKICWIDVCQMHQFETAYREWLEQFSLDACQQAACHLSESLTSLIDRLTQLKNVYPKGTLHDCEESSPDDNPILLNQTALGTANP